MEPTDLGNVLGWTSIEMNQRTAQFDSNDSGKPAVGHGGFATTRWSVIVAAGKAASGDSEKALSELCCTYWYPLYVFVRRRGYSPARAEDLTQAFFTRLIEKKTFQTVKPDGGRFRSFLLKAITNFLNNEHRFESAKKRGGTAKHLSIDFAEGERQYAVEPADAVTPDLLFERKWALAALEQARGILAESYRDDPKLFEAIKRFVSVDDANVKYSELAEELHMSESAVKVAVHRLRKRFAEKLRLVIAETVTTDSEIADEIAYLMSVFRK